MLNTQYPIVLWLWKFCIGYWLLNIIFFKAAPHTPPPPDAHFNRSGYSSLAGGESSFFRMASSPFEEGGIQGGFQGVKHVNFNPPSRGIGTPPFLRRRKQSVCRSMNGKQKKKYPILNAQYSMSNCSLALDILYF